jgi:hypothetical protein
LGYNSIFGKNIFSLLAHPVKISALIIFFVREVMRSLVPFYNPEEFKFFNIMIGTPTFSDIL